MAPEEIAAVMQEAFAAIGGFIGRSAVAAVGPPLAVYRDWDAATGTMKIDVGFPVAAADTARAEGKVKSGRTPSGKAFKAPPRSLQDAARDLRGSHRTHQAGRTAGADARLGSLHHRPRQNAGRRTPHRDLRGARLRAPTAIVACRPRTSGHNRACGAVRPRHTSPRRGRGARS